MQRSGLLSSLKLFPMSSPSSDLRPLTSDPLVFDDHWDLLIKPHTRLLDLHLADVWRYRDLLCEK